MNRVNRTNRIKIYKENRRRTNDRMNCMNRNDRIENLNDEIINRINIIKRYKENRRRINDRMNKID
jgi:hypothetical protein